MFKKKLLDMYTLMNLSPERILPSSAQPRRSFEGEDLAELCESIRQNGIVQPLTVRLLENGKYMLISGERRLKAAKMAGFSKVPCVVLRSGEQNAAVYTLLDNLQHKPLDYFDEADAIYTLISHWGVAREDVAARLGITQSALSAKLRLLRLTRWQRERIQSAHLTERHARAFLKIEDNDMRDNAILTVIAKGLSIPETELLAERKNSSQPEIPVQRTKCRPPIIGDSRLIVNTVTNAVESIRRAGISATSDKKETERYIEFRIVVQKDAFDQQMRLSELDNYKSV